MGNIHINLGSGWLYLKFVMGSSKSDRIVNTVISILLGGTLSTSFVMILLLKRYIQDTKLEIFTLVNVLIFTGSTIVLSVLLRKFVLNDD